MTELGGSPRRADPQLARIRSNVAGVAWPRVSLGTAGSVAALLRQLDRTQWLDAETVQAAQLRQLRLLASHLATLAPHFGDRLRAAGLTPEDLGTTEGLRSLPPLRRRDLQDAGAELFSREVPKDHGPVIDVKSSGSTGEPIVVRRTGVNGIVWSAMTLRDHLWHQVDFRGRFSSSRFSVDRLMSYAEWGDPVSLLFASGPAQTVPLLSSIEELADAVTAFSPHLLQTYPSVLGPLTEHLVDRGIGLPHLRSVHTIGETLPPDIRTRAMSALGVGVWDTYSCEEVGNIALECPEHPGYHVLAESLIVEVLDEEGRPCPEGGVGRVVVTDLHNLATPLVRYDLGDYAEVGGECPCGRGLPVLRRVVGRYRNLVCLPDGTRHWPVVGLFKYRDIAPIRQFQFVQRDLDSIDVTMVADRRVTAEEERDLTEVIQSSLGYRFAVRFTWRDEPLPRGPGGKFEEFRCEV